LNPHSPCGPADFKSAASADFAIRASLRLERGARSQGRQVTRFIVSGPKTTKGGGSPIFANHLPLHLAFSSD
jgi:hypothetical protein